MITIREATDDDFENNNGIWSIFHEIVKEGETYAYPMTCTKEDGKHYWMEYPRKTYVAVDGVNDDANDGDSKPKILGTYYIKTNQIESGSGDHVCNCGYMVSSNHVERV